MKHIKIYVKGAMSFSLNSVLFLTGITAFLLSDSITVTAQALQSVESKITGVTVFESQAQVVREVQVHAKAGSNTVILKNLPGLLRDESLRIKASKGVKITDIKIETRMVRDSSKMVADKTTAIADSLKRVIDKSANRIALYDAKQKLIESFKSQFVKNLNEKLYSDAKTMHQWSELLEYTGKNLSQVLVGKRREQRIRNKAEIELNNIQDKKTQNDVVLVRLKDVVVTYQSESEQTVTFNPVYRISGCGWNAQYDLRVDSNDKTAQIQYYGMVSQNTGEDWNGVNVVLSTADPVNNNELPELNPLIVGKEYRPPTPPNSKLPDPKSGKHVTVQYSKNYGLEYNQSELVGNVTDAKTGEALLGVQVVLENAQGGGQTDLNGNFRIVTVPSSNARVKIQFIGYKTMLEFINLEPQTTATLTIGMEETLVQSSACVIIADKPEVEKNMTTTRMSTSDDIQVLPVGEKQGDFKFVSTSAKSLSTVFTIPAKTAIPSDNLKHKVTIAIKTLPASYEYIAVPRVSQAVYLKGKIVNANDYPLLPGAVSIFVDNEFVNTTTIKTIVPTDTLELPLGVDNRIKMERKLVRKFTESGGTFSNSKTIAYDYENNLTNMRGTKETITVMDNFPFSETEAVKVSLIEPDPAVVKPSAANGLEWKIELNPGEKRTLPVKFTVTSKEGDKIYGLD
jgi:hypothetical protein